MLNVHKFLIFCGINDSTFFQITSIINDAIQSPDNTNELKKLQMRELALLNGTLRDEDLLKCRNCGALVSIFVDV